MNQTFKLKKGGILFEGDKIIIKDDAKKQKWILTLILCLGTIYGALTFLRYFKTGDQFDYWFGLIIALLNILILTVWLLRSFRSEISINEVKSMKIKHRFRNKFLDIRLNNNRLRRVIRVENAVLLEEFIKTNFESKWH